MRRRRGRPAGAHARILLALILAAGAPAGTRGAEVFLAANPDPACPCGDGHPPPAPCGETPGRPLACWADAYARAGRAGDGVTFLAGDHEACLAIDDRGRPSAPFVCRGATPGGVSIRCRKAVDAVRLSGGTVVLEDLRIIADTDSPAAVHIAADASGQGGRHALRRLVVEGARTGILLEGAGRNLLDDVTISGASTGLQIVSAANHARGLRLIDSVSSALILAPAAARNRIERFEVRRAGGLGLLVMSGARDNRFEDGIVAKTGAHGGEIRGSGTIVRRCAVSAARIHGLLVAGRDTPVDGVRIESCDIHHNGSSDDDRPMGDGIKIEVATGTIVRGTRIAANTSNGTSSFAHGVYTKGEGGIIRGCRVRGNSGYGLHLWAAPRDDLVEDNEVTGNGTVRGGGIVVGGTPKEAPPGRSGLPERVVVRRNHLSGNMGPALDCLLPAAGPPEGCWPGTGGNEFLDNDITPVAGTLPVRLRGARPECVAVRGNVVRAPTPPATDLPEPVAPAIP
jgi:hypothetical protein